MSDILDKLNILKENLKALDNQYQSTNLENQLLKNQQGQLVAEKAALIKKNETAKSHLKSLLERIENIKDYGKDQSRHKYTRTRYFGYVYRGRKRYSHKIA